MSSKFCCSFCDSARMVQIMDLGSVALAGGFLQPSQFATEARYPLRLHFCTDCCAVQVTDHVNARVLFSDYFYFSSSIQTLRDHFRAYAAEIAGRFLVPEQATVLEFGCNDGVLLRPLADLKVRTVIGVDPATNVVKTIDDPRIAVINDFFTQEVAAEVVRRHGPVDVVMANNVYAHIPDIQGTTRAVHDVLAPDGVFVFEVHYLGSVIEGMQYDMIYHEHLYYYSLTSAQRHFARHGMAIFDVALVPIHAGSIRFYVCKQESKYAAQRSERVRALEQEERGRGYDCAATFVNFAERVEAHKAELMRLLGKLRTGGARIAGYGASGRANTMIQYCEIDDRHIDYMIDDAPAKAGYYTPGSHLLIRPSAVLEQEAAPDYLLVFAWSFLDEIARRCAGYLARGGRLIVPLPSVSIIDGIHRDR